MNRVLPTVNTKIKQLTNREAKKIERERDKDNKYGSANTSTHSRITLYIFAVRKKDWAFDVDGKRDDQMDLEISSYLFC